MLLYTSGTTGKPKGILHSMDSFTHSKIFFGKAMAGMPRGKATAMASFSFVLSLDEIFGFLLLGFEVHLIGEDMRMSLTRFSDYASREKPDAGFLTASHLKAFEGKDLPFSRIILVGEAFPSLPASAFEKCEYVNVYGQSELLGSAISHFVKAGESPVPISRPLSGIEAVILMEDGKPAAPGEKGELCLKGPYDVSYFKDEERTRRQFEKLPDGRTLIHTGDTAYADENGDIFHAGRLDFMVKINGQRVDMTGVETAVSKVPGVHAAAVKTVTGAGGRTALAAYFTADDSVDAEKIRQSLRMTMPEYMVPMYIIKLDRMPLNSSGKKDREALPDPMLHEDTSADPPRNETEKHLCAILEEILSCGKVGRNDDLQALGADSLSLMKISVRLENEFGLHLIPAEILAKGTAAAIAAMITGDEPETAVKEASAGTVSGGKESVNSMNVLTALCMFTLPLVHLAQYLEEDGWLSRNVVNAVFPLLFYAQPFVFMLVAGYRLSKGSRSGESRIREGLEFIKINIILDLIRFGIPAIVCVLAESEEWSMFLKSIGTSDIYIFLGLFFVLFGLVKKYKPGLKVVIPAVLAMIAIYHITPMFWNGSEDYIPGTLLGLLIFTGDYSYFPLFGAVYVPLVGYAAGLWLNRHNEDRRKAELRLGLVSLAVFAVTAPFSKIQIYDNVGSYFIPLHQTLFHMGICGALMTLPRFPENRFFRWLDRTSSLIIPFYLSQWVLVSWCGVLLYAFVPCVGWEYLAYAAGISVLSYLIAKKFGSKLIGLL